MQLPYLLAPKMIIPNIKTLYQVMNLVILVYSDQIVYYFHRKSTYTSVSPIFNYVKIFSEGTPF